MIYNLGKYIKDKLTDAVETELADALTINGEYGAEKREAVYLNETGGARSHDIRRKDYTAQIITTTLDRVKGKQWAEKVFALIENIFAVKLPEMTVGGTSYPEIEAAQISPIQLPAYMGMMDKGGLHVTVFNIVVTTK